MTTHIDKICLLKKFESLLLLIFVSWIVYNRIMHFRNWVRADDPNANRYYWGPVIRPFVGAFHLWILLLLLFVTFPFSFLEFLRTVGIPCDQLEYYGDYDFFNNEITVKT